MKNETTITISPNDLNEFEKAGRFTKTAVFRDGAEVELNFSLLNGLKVCKTTLFLGLCGVAETTDEGESVMKDKNLNYFGDTYCILLA